jgi:hypothetical protein
MGQSSSPIKRSTLAIANVSRDRQVDGMAWAVPSPRSEHRFAVGLHGIVAVTRWTAPSRTVRTVIWSAPPAGTFEMIQARLPCCWVK